MNTTDLKFDKLHLSTRTSFVSRYADYLILCLVASVGLIGSLYVFANRTIDLGTASLTETSILSPGSQAWAGVPVNSKDKFDSLVSIEGSYAAGSELKMTLIPDQEDARYYLDMGNKERAIFSGQTAYYRYRQPGTYVIQLKVLKDRLLTTLASKEIVVK